jgi:hypothetical protein
MPHTRRANAANGPAPVNSARYGQRQQRLQRRTVEILEHGEPAAPVGEADAIATLPLSVATVLADDLDLQIITPPIRLARALSQ